MTPNNAQNPRLSKVICFPFMGDSVGGSHVSAVLLIKELINLGYRVRVLLHIEGPLARYLRSTGLDFEILALRYPLSGNFSLFRLIFTVVMNVMKVRKFLKNGVVSIVHTNEIRCNLLWSLATRQQTKHVWHQRTAIGRPWMWRFVPLLTDQVIAISRFIEVNIASSKVLQVYNPFLYAPPDRNRARKRLSAIIDTDLNSKIVIGYIGRIEYAKGLMCLSKRFQTTKRLKLS